MNGIRIAKVGGTKKDNNNLEVSRWGRGLAQTQRKRRLGGRAVTVPLAAKKCHWSILSVTFSDVLRFVFFQYGKQLYVNYQEAMKRTEAAYDWSSLSTSSIRSGSSSASIPGALLVCCPSVKMNSVKSRPSEEITFKFSREC